MTRLAPTDRKPSCIQLLHATNAWLIANTTILLLMLSLVCLVSAGDVDTTIRLPSDGKGLADEASMLVARKKQGGVERPWKCCDRTICTRSMPPVCLCLDEVERCADACKRCEPADSDPSLYVCRDEYFGDPGPRCTEDAGGHVVPVGDADHNRMTPAGAEKEARRKGDGEERPWKCCDEPVCTSSMPPVCICTDSVERCADTCKHCQEDDEDPSLRVCTDQYLGRGPGPRCTEDAAIAAAGGN